MSELRLNQASTSLSEAEVFPASHNSSSLGTIRRERFRILREQTAEEWNQMLTSFRSHNGGLAVGSEVSPSPSQLL